MAPLPSNNTGVVFLDYSVGGENHTAQVRYSSSSSFVDAMTVLDDFLTALGGLISVITIIGARHRPQGSNVTLPVTWTGAATYGVGTATHAESAFYIDFVGRSAGGRRVRLSVFGSDQAIDLAESDYRLPATGAVLDALTVLTNASDIVVAIDNGAPVWNQYANLGINAYWRNRIR